MKSFDCDRKIPLFLKIHRTFQTIGKISLNPSKMKNFAIVSVLLLCFLVVSITARSFAPVDLARVSAAMKAGVPYAVVANAPVIAYAPAGKFPCNPYA